MTQQQDYVNWPYTIVVAPEKCTDGSVCYLARHPELPGCMSHGDTPEEAISNLAEARRLVIEHLVETKQAVPKPVAAGLVPVPTIVRWRNLGEGPTTSATPVKFAAA